MEEAKTHQLGNFTSTMSTLFFFFFGMFTLILVLTAKHGNVPKAQAITIPSSLALTLKMFSVILGVKALLHLR